MRKQEVDRKLFHRAHYNILAKQIREPLTRAYTAEQFYRTEQDGDTVQLTKASMQVATLVDLALSLCNRLALDNADFEPEMFLDACTPHGVPEHEMLSELWEGVDDSEVER